MTQEHAPNDTPPDRAAESGDAAAKSTRAFTGRGRRKKTPWIVHASDRISQTVITVGGIGTIIAVSLVFVFLAYVVAPLFVPPPQPRQASEFHSPWDSAGAPVRLEMDEYRTMAYAIADDGQLVVFRLDTGEVVERRTLVETTAPITCVSGSVGRADICLGFADGTVRFAALRFVTTFLDPQDAPQHLQSLPVGDLALHEGGVVQMTPQHQLRRQQLEIDVRPAVPVSDVSLVCLDHVPVDLSGAGLGGASYRCVVLDANHELKYCELTGEEDLLSGETTWETTAHALPLPGITDTTPLAVLVSTRGDRVLLAAKNGQVWRFDTRQPDQAKLCEELHVLGDNRSELTACKYLLGRETVLFGDSQGQLQAWFHVRRDTAETSDGFQLTRVHPLPAGAAAVTALGSSERSRMVTVGYANGEVAVYHVTTEQQIVRLPTPSDQAITFALFAPKDDGLFLATREQAMLWDFEPGYPEATLATLFRPVWYEGYAGPQHIWQSSFSGVDSEMKLGMWPLVFGTLKATFYCMLFGAPLALMAAIYTSEFAHPRTRARIKPVVEMMASLPSVVLGFLAALVFAPWVERLVPATLASFVTIPLTFLLAALIWQLLPARTVLTLTRFRFLLLFPCLPLGMGLAYILGPVLEQWFFAGDMTRWLDGQIGNGTGAWLILVLPLTALLVGGTVSGPVNSILRNRCGDWSRQAFAACNLAKFMAAVAVTLLLSWGLSSALTAIGWDPRGTYVDTYVQRNALVVGFVMGFAVIPIIFTIADDALSTVPKHLRSASLGAGATAWQTATRIVVPTAMSGLFSALMIGLGRAVGETMVVLMAAGNTPVLELNIFNGFRTLAANIAVELPEAVRDSTHYRTLFLAALTLFLMTFVINTLAELVRQRFRRRAIQL